MKQWEIDVEVCGLFTFYAKGVRAETAKKKLIKILESGDLTMRIYPGGSLADSFTNEEDTDGLPHIVEDGVRIREDTEEKGD